MQNYVGVGVVNIVKIIYNKNNRPFNIFGIFSEKSACAASIKVSCKVKGHLKPWETKRNHRYGVQCALSVY